MKQKLLNYFQGDDLAAEVWMDKYAADGEETPDDMHKRMAKEFARIDKDYQEKENDITHLSFYGQQRGKLSDSAIYELFKDFKYVVPQGSIMSQLGVESIGSLSNCFVISSPSDSYGAIMKSDEELAQLFKRRSGVGVDISYLRPNNARVSNAAKSSTGAVSFMHRFSNTTREVSQSGRRGR